MGEEQATASGAADRTADERGATGEGARVEAATNTASEPTGPPPGTAPPWGRGHLISFLLLCASPRYPWCARGSGTWTTHA